MQYAPTFPTALPSGNCPPLPDAPFCHSYFVIRHSPRPAPPSSPCLLFRPSLLPGDLFIAEQAFECLDSGAEEIRATETGEFARRSQVWFEREEAIEAGVA